MKLFKNCVYENGTDIYFHRQENLYLLADEMSYSIISECQMAAKYFKNSDQSLKISPLKPRQ